MIAIDRQTPSRPSRALRAMLLAACCCDPLAANSAEPGIEGRWRFTHALPAPWGPALPASADLTGQILTISAKAMQGPKPFACGGLHGQAVQLPPEGLFQGGLPAPAATAAQSLGLDRFPVASSSLSCDSGLFDFHHADGDTVLIGLDNRVWSLSRAPGAMAAADAPEGVVERLLEAHFGGDMGFSQPVIADKLVFLSAGLRQAIERYFAKPQPLDEVPAIDGDPFTDSQEYPTRFAVQQARIANDAAQTEVVFSDAGRRRFLIYRLIREAGAWRLDDIDYPAGNSFRGLLQ
ncbi:MAG: hypothetical protein PHH11_12745 [Methylomonas sp.]|nr:hypothetical protein [Methylomonas sp.]